MAAITKNVFSNQFSISFPIMSWVSELWCGVVFVILCLAVLVELRLWQTDTGPWLVPLAGGDGWTGEYRLETGSRHIAFKRLHQMAPQSLVVLVGWLKVVSKHKCTDHGTSATIGHILMLCMQCDQTTTTVPVLFCKRIPWNSRHLERKRWQLHMT